MFKTCCQCTAESEPCGRQDAGRRTLSFRDSCPSLQFAKNCQSKKLQSKQTNTSPAASQKKSGVGKSWKELGVPESGIRLPRVMLICTCLCPVRRTCRGRGDLGSKQRVLFCPHEFLALAKAKGRQDEERHEIFMASNARKTIAKSSFTKCVGHVPNRNAYHGKLEQSAAARRPTTEERSD